LELIFIFWMTAFDQVVSTSEATLDISHFSRYLSISTEFFTLVEQEHFIVHSLILLCRISQNLTKLVSISEWVVHTTVILIFNKLIRWIDESQEMRIGDSNQCASPEIELQNMCKSIISLIRTLTMPPSFSLIMQSLLQNVINVLNGHLAHRGDDRVNTTNHYRERINNSTNYQLEAHSVLYNSTFVFTLLKCIGLILEGEYIRGSSSNTVPQFPTSFNMMHFTKISISTLECCVAISKDCAQEASRILLLVCLVDKQLQQVLLEYVTKLNEADTAPSSVRQIGSVRPRAGEGDGLRETVRITSNLSHSYHERDSSTLPERFEAARGSKRPRHGHEERSQDRLERAGPSALASFGEQHSDG